jgi:hypothetical protein
MIAQILELLATNKFYGQSELIEIAKGKNKLEHTFKGKREQLKRAKQWQQRKR